MSGSEEKKRMGRPPQHGPRHNLTMSWPVEDIAVADAAAEEENVTRTELTLRAVRNYVSQLREQKEKAPHAVVAQGEGMADC